MHGLEKEFGDRITFVRVNITNDENLEIMEQFGFIASPEFYLVDENDQIIGAWADDLVEEEVRRTLKQALQ